MALPALGLPALKAKIDTGAGTSALHAFRIEPFEGTGADAGQHMVRFEVHPVPGRNDIAVPCVAPMTGRRWVTSSNGERELRPVIATPIAVGGRRWTIEITLTNREAMRFRMLLGHQALLDDTIVMPRSGSLQPRLGYDVYGGVRGDRPRGLRIGLLHAASQPAVRWRQLAVAAGARGHSTELIDTTECVISFSAPRPRLMHRGLELGGIDAVIAGFGAHPALHALSVLRHLELQESLAINAADSLMLVDDPYRVIQMMVSNGHATGAQRLQPDGIVTSDPDHGAVANTKRLSCLTIGGLAVAAMRLQPSPRRVRMSKEERRLASGVARLCNLGLARVDLSWIEGQCHVSGIDPDPRIDDFQQDSSIDIAARLFEWFERKCPFTAVAP